MDALIKSAVCVLVLYLANTPGATSQVSRNLTLEAFRARSSTYQASRAPTIKPPNTNQRPYVINLLQNPLIHGFLGDAPIPGYDNITSENRSSTNKWRIVCSRVSEIFVIVMNVEMKGKGEAGKGAEYLQIRRKMVRGTNNKYYAYHLKKNSILVAHVNAPSMPSSYYPFRIAYFCIPQVTQNDVDLVEKAQELLLNNCILKFISEHPDVLDDLDWLFQGTDFTISYNNLPSERSLLNTIKRIEFDTFLNTILSKADECDTKLTSS